MDIITQKHKTFCLKDKSETANDKGWYGCDGGLVHLAREFKNAADAIDHAKELNAEAGYERYAAYCKNVTVDASLLSDMILIDTEKPGTNDADVSISGVRAPWS